MTWCDGLFFIDYYGAKTMQVHGHTNKTFGVHFSSFWRGWVVTHLPTGFAIAHTYEPRKRHAFNLKPAAMEFADAIAPLTDWHAITIENAAAIRDEHGERLRAAIQAAAGPIVMRDALAS